jgi:hypothetical protein
LLIFASLFVIIQEDFKYAALPPMADIGMEGVTLALLCAFVVEIGEPWPGAKAPAHKTFGG